MKKVGRTGGVLSLQGRGRTSTLPLSFSAEVGGVSQHGKNIGTWKSTCSTQCSESGLQRGVGRPDILFLIQTVGGLELWEPGYSCSLCLAYLLAACIRIIFQSKGDAFQLGSVR